MTLEAKIRTIIATSIYSDPKGGFAGYDTAAKRIMELLEREKLLHSDKTDYLIKTFK